MNERKDIDSNAVGDVSSEARWAAIRDAIKQYVGAEEAEYQELVDEKYEQILESYYVLATKEKPTERESAWLYSIMEDAESNDDLAVLLEIVDEITFDELGYNEKDYKPTLKATYQRAKEQVLKIRDTYHHTGNLPSLLDTQLSETVDPSDKSENVFSGLFLSMLRNCNPTILVRTGIVSASALVVAVITFKASFTVNRNYQPLGIMQSTSEERSSGEKSFDTDSNHQCATKQIGWISDSYEGLETKYSEIYDPSDRTASHPFLPPQSEIYIYPNQSHSEDPVKVRVIDRGGVGEEQDGMLVSHGTAEALDIVDAGIANIEIARVIVNNQSRNRLDLDQTKALARFRNACASMVESVERTDSAIAESQSESE